jgi:hypothetical protein
MEVHYLKEIILICLLLMGTTYPGNSSESLIILTNSIDAGLNSDLINFLGTERTVTLVKADEFESYKTNTYILILGGHRASEGVGEIVERVLNQQEKEEITREKRMIVKLNLWKDGQVVVILAGPDREQTCAVCQENSRGYVSLLKAIEAVQENLISPDYDMIAFLWPHTISSTDYLAPYFPHHSLTTESSPRNYPIEEECWFFWIDDLPYAKFAHPVRFILFGIESGEYSVYDEEWWPVLNKKSLWAADTEYWNRFYWVYNPDLKRPKPSILIQKVGAALTFPDVSPDKALVVNGWKEGEFSREDMIEDQATMASILERMGFTVERVSSIREMQMTLKNWGRVMEPFDSLVIYNTGHGGKDFLVIGGEKLTVKEFGGLLDGFDEQVHIGIIIDSCFSGTFMIDDIKEKAAFIITATSGDAYAFGDWDPKNDTNPGDKGSEFTSGFVESLAAYFPESGEQPLSPKDVYGRIFGTIDGIMIDGFIGAKEKDAACQNGYSNPQMWVKEAQKIPYEDVTYK